MQNFSIGSLWSQAWTAFKRNWITGIGLLILSGIAALIPILGNLITLFLQAVYVQWGLRNLESEEPVSFGSAFPSNIGTYIKVILGSFVIFLIPAIIFAIGYALLLPSMASESMGYGSQFSPIAFIIFLVGALFLFVFQVLFFSYPYWIVDQNLGIGSGLGKSYQFSSRNLGKVVVFLLSALGINLLGALPCFLGLLITAPMTWIAGAGLYKSLKGSIETNPQV